MKIRIWGKIRKWVRKKENILIEFLTGLFWIIIGITGLCLYFLGFLDLYTLLEVLFGLLLAFLPIYFYLIKKREQTMLISFTSKYLLEKEEAKIDELLGILIAGKWEKLKIDPMEEFFKCIKKLCLKDDTEIKRRIAEALPALFKIDLDESKEIVEILREDWGEKWKSDNRRRTIESLSYIISKDENFVKDNLVIIDKDEIFTIIAIVEVLAKLKEKTNEKRVEKHFAELKTKMKNNYTEDEINAVNELWNLLNLIHYDVDKAIERFEESKKSVNIYLQICIARNLRLLCKKYPSCKTKNLCKGSPERVLNLMEFFLQEDKHCNVRRPIAKEDSLRCLIILLQYERYSNQAKRIIWKLINDKDDIIRVTAFDMIEKILDTDATYGMKILAHVIKENHYPRLVERAKTLMARYKS